MSITQRICTSCGQELPATEENFGRQKDRKSGKYRLRAVCRPCRADQERERHYAKVGRRPERLPTRQKRCSECRQVKPRDAEHFLVENGRVRSPCRECQRKRAKAQYAAHSESYKLRATRWIKANREKYRAYSATNRARRMAAEGSYTPEEIAALHAAQRGRCHWCHAPMRGKFERDHRIALSRGGTNDIGNIVLAHPRCNRAKNNKMPWEFAEGRLL